MNCKYKSNMTKKKAFTLIELLIVIAIIGILFIVLVSKVDFATDNAKASGVQTDFRSFQVALEMVSKENAGFNTFGWDTGDNGGGVAAGATITLNDKSYTYTNALKDAGDRIRNSYDVGDTNLNGKYDDGEVWTGRKIYTENWTGCYTLINPGDASDMSAIFDLETAINKNLDPKLHINIADDGTITMANGLKDPWSTQYHGQYITNASADAAAKWNTDASMNGSTGDNMDRGAILMYSNGANQKFGTKVKIEKGVVTATVSQIDADHLDNNKMGADDYVLAVVYTYTNGYGETAAITDGFSNNQVFLTGNGGNVSNAVTPGGNGGTLQLPAENPSGNLDDYTWLEIKALAQAKLSKEDYKNKYGIDLGEKVDNKYILVDFDNYGGFVFMYDSGIDRPMDKVGSNDPYLNPGRNTGGYPASSVTEELNNIYLNLHDTDNELYNVIKEVTIICNDGYNNPNAIHEYKCKLFLASLVEVGYSISRHQYQKEGTQFEYLINNANRKNVCSSTWWLRTANTDSTNQFVTILNSGNGYNDQGATRTYSIVPCFVIG